MRVAQSGIFALGTGSHSYLEFELLEHADPLTLVQAIANLRRFTQAQLDAYDRANMFGGGSGPTYDTYSATQTGQDAISRLLRHFMENPGRVFSRERLLDSVWGQDSEIELRTVDVHIRRLRKAINANQKADIIRTVRSAGYALDADGHR